MEQWNNKDSAVTGNTTQTDSPSKRTLRMVLDNIALHEYSNYNTLESFEQADRRRKIRDQLNTRLKYLFAKSDGIHLSRQWVTHGPMLPEYDMLFDQETMDRILREPSDEETALDEFLQNGVRQPYILAFLLSYLVKIHQKTTFPQITDDFRAAKTKEILMLARYISEKGVRLKKSHEKIDKIWAQFIPLLKEQKISHTSVECQFQSDLIKKVSIIINTSYERVSTIIKVNESLKEIHKRFQEYLAKWPRIFDQMQEKYYNMVQSSMFFTEEDDQIFLCDDEAGFLCCLFKALPYKDQFKLKELQKDRWEVLDTKVRNRLIYYINTLSEKPNVMNRYIGAYDEVDCDEQIEVTLLKLRNPWYYRIRKKMIQTAEIIDSNKIPEEKQPVIENMLDSILGELNALELSDTDESTTMLDLSDMIPT
jgi:hypothetical protein